MDFRIFESHLLFAGNVSYSRRARLLLNKECANSPHVFHAFLDANFEQPHKRNNLKNQMVSLQLSNAKRGASGSRRT